MISSLFLSLAGGEGGLAKEGQTEKEEKKENQIKERFLNFSNRFSLNGDETPEEFKKIPGTRELSKQAQVLGIIKITR